MIQKSIKSPNTEKTDDMTKAANDNRFSPEVEMLRDAIDALEENAEALNSEDFDEVEKLMEKFKTMLDL